MSNFHLHKVVTPLDVKNFHAVAAAIYAGDSNWVHPLANDIEDVFDAKKNHLFEGGDAIRWLLQDSDSGLYVGRIAAFYNDKKAALERQPTGGCGFFECIDNFDAAKTLFDAARNWLAERGMEAMDGSINFGDRMRWWGVLVDGFSQPLYGMSYNRPYYGALFEKYGFQNYFNQTTYLRPLASGITMPSALHQKAQRLSDNDHFECRNFDKSNLDAMVDHFCTIYNDGWATFEGVQPLTRPDAVAMISAMMPIIDSDTIIMAYLDGEPVGFFVMIPDLNQIIGKFRGKFGIVQKLKLLWAIKRKRVDRLAGLIFGIVPSAQGKGVDAAMIRHFEASIQGKEQQGKLQYKTLEMGWVGDFNPVMMRMCESYVMATPYKRHTTFRYMFNPDAPFERAPRLRVKKQ